jgi:uncharacterized protein YoxC
MEVQPILEGLEGECKMSKEVDQIETRVTVLESELVHTKDDIKELKAYSNEIFDIVSGTKEKLDKQNGAIPHLVEQVTKLIDKHENFNNKFNDFVIKSEGNSVKTKILWGIFITVISSGICIIFKLLNL